MNLSQRVLENEWMDDPHLAKEPHVWALRGLQRINRFSGTASVLANAIRNHGLKERPLRILDLACGGGDVTRQLAKGLEKMGLPCVLQGWDISPTAVAYANQEAAKEKLNHLSFHRRDVLAEEMSDEFDVILCTLFLHHLTESQGAQLIATMVQNAKRLVLIDDLRRTPFGLLLANLACRILTRSPIVRMDGPMSVRAAFLESELISLCDQAKVPRPHIHRHWPQRFLLQWRL